MIHPVALHGNSRGASLSEGRHRDGRFLLQGPSRTRPPHRHGRAESGP